jgi:hypothetical protein
MNCIPWNVVDNYTYNKSIGLLTAQKTEHLQLLTAHKFWIKVSLIQILKDLILHTNALQTSTIS